MANLLAVVAGALFSAFIAEIALALFVGGAVWYYRRNAAKALDSVPPTAPAQS
jgi:ABC-type tungstate transport system substrate-binding protein